MRFFFFIQFISFETFATWNTWKLGWYLMLVLKCFRVLFVSVLKWGNCWTFEFFRNVFHWIQLLKIFVIKRARICNFLCQRPGCYHNASKEQVRDRIFMLMLQWFIRFLEFTEFWFHAGQTPVVLTFHLV